MPSTGKNQHSPLPVRLFPERRVTVIESREDVDRGFVDPGSALFGFELDFERDASGVGWGGEIDLHPARALHAPRYPRFELMGRRRPRLEQRNLSG